MFSYALLHTDMQVLAYLLQELCTDTGCRHKDLPEEVEDREGDR